MQLRLHTTIGLAYAERYSNCVYGTVSENDYDMANQALCTFDTVIEPGKAYKLSEPLGLDVTKQALFELFGDQAFPVTAATTASTADGPTLSLVPAGTAATDGTAANRQVIDADNTADMAGVGDTADGKPGDVVKVTVALHNDGPGWVGINASDDQPALLVTIPTGTSAVEIPDHCSVWREEAKSGTGEQTPGKPKYVCQSSPSEYAVGEARKFTFGLKIKANTTDTTIGEVRATTAYDNELTFDDNKANDTAAITVTVSSGTTGGNQPRTQTDTGSELAETGGSSGTPWIAAAGGLAVVVGAVLFGSVRLRRRRT
ncbi:LPXTG cell wall anchor domain-containing protein [Streptomyces sp. NBC_01537]|uniref:LAETG motif-containing sortase-dependent surface protein n=1 Tax=Streptomyces sp. NBC_01537 TaxID=2903896 RepID=UPI003864FD2E